MHTSNTRARALGGVFRWLAGVAGRVVRDATTHSILCEPVLRARQFSSVYAECDRLAFATGYAERERGRERELIELYSKAF